MALAVRLVVSRRLVQAWHKDSGTCDANGRASPGSLQRKARNPLALNVLGRAMRHRTNPVRPGAASQLGSGCDFCVHRHPLTACDRQPARLDGWDKTWSPCYAAPLFFRRCRNGEVRGGLQPPGPGHSETIRYGGCGLTVGFWPTPPAAVCGSTAAGVEASYQPGVRLPTLIKSRLSGRTLTAPAALHTIAAGSVASASDVVRASQHASRKRASAGRGVDTRARGCVQRPAYNGVPLRRRSHQVVLSTLARTQFDRRATSNGEGLRGTLLLRTAPRCQPGCGMLHVRRRVRRLVLPRPRLLLHATFACALHGS